MVRCTMLGDEELGRVYHAEFFAWYAQRVYKTSRNELNTIYVMHERTHAPLHAHPDAHMPSHVYPLSYSLCDSLAF